MIGIYYSAISAFLAPHHNYEALYHPIISKLMHHFIYSILLHVSGLIHGMFNIYIILVRKLGSGLFSS